MKKIILGFAVTTLLFSCKTQNVSTPKQPVSASINLVDIENDKVWVTVDPDKFDRDTITFHIPKTVPGTYSTDNYGKFSENFEALDYKGELLSVTKIDENSWMIPNAKNLDKVKYQVNDSFDWENEGGVYSMAGTNILDNKNFLLNLHGFVGYFKGTTEEKYQLNIERPAHLIPGTSLDVAQSRTARNGSSKIDVFNLNRYFEVIDNPIMYAAADTSKINIQGMEVLLNVYSPNKKYTSRDILPAMKKMLQAQKRFLGEIDNTDKYAILLYLAEDDKPDAGNFGALEHHTSTVVVLSESMNPESLEETMIDIVSHEFFHILTPLNVHSKEIHYFDYNDPKMSQHLWMYEGVTEYFANLFQVNQGLISNQEFYDRMMDKIRISKNFDDTVPFTVMSKNILDDEYKNSYYNVYMKGALIGMALDIRLRELSGGEKGILDLMKSLSDRYGKDKPFDDDNLIADIVELTYPEIQTFFDKYITGSTPIPYNDFFNKVGLIEQEQMSEVGFFLKGRIPYIRADRSTMEIVFRDDIELNSFLKKIGVQGGDVLKAVNGEAYTIQNVFELIQNAENWKSGDTVTMKLIRNGKEVDIESEITTPMDKDLKLIESESANISKTSLREAWLKN